MSRNESLGVAARTAVIFAFGSVMFIAAVQSALVLKRLSVTATNAKNSGNNK